MWGEMGRGWGLVFGVERDWGLVCGVVERAAYFYHLSWEARTPQTMFTLEIYISSEMVSSPFFEKHCNRCQNTNLFEVCYTSW